MVTEHGIIQVEGKSKLLLNLIMLRLHIFLGRSILLLGKRLGH